MKKSSSIESVPYRNMKLKRAGPGAIERLMDGCTSRMESATPLPASVCAVCVHDLTRRPDKTIYKPAGYFLAPEEGTGRRFIQRRIQQWMDPGRGRPGIHLLRVF